MIACETRRMMDVFSATLLTIPNVLFLRYNPGGYFNGEEFVSRKAADRHPDLLSELQRERDFEGLQIQYLNYDLDKCLPALISDPDFPSELLPCVKQERKHVHAISK